MEITSETSQDVNLSQFLESHGLEFPFFVKHGCHYEKVVGKRKSVSVADVEGGDITQRGYLQSDEPLSLFKKLVRTKREDFESPDRPVEIIDENTFYEKFDEKVNELRRL